MGNCSSETKDLRTLKKDWNKKYQEQVKKTLKKLDVSSDSFMQEEIAQKIFRRFNNNVKNDELDLQEISKLVKYALHKNGKHSKAQTITTEDAKILIVKMTGKCKDSITKQELIDFVEWSCQNDRFSSSF